MRTTDEHWEKKWEELKELGVVTPFGEPRHHTSSMADLDMHRGKNRWTSPKSEVSRWEKGRLLPCGRPS